VEGERGREKEGSKFIWVDCLGPKKKKLTAAILQDVQSAN
jgi:hypothetical protein